MSPAKILKIFLFWRIGLLAVTYLGSLTFPLIQNSGIGAIGPGKSFDYWASWAQWDGGHYLDIAASGYLDIGNYAFFPLFPTLAGIVHHFLKLDLITSGLLISNIAFVLFLIVFFKLTTRLILANSGKDQPQEVAYASTITLLLFPTSFFATAYYSESLFLLIVTLAFACLWRKNFLLAALLASLASLTRLMGAMLIVSVFYSYFASIKFNPAKVNIKLLHIAAAFFGISVYSIYLFFNLNDPLRFLTSQSNWQRTVTDPISTIVSYIWPIVTYQLRPYSDWLDLGFTLLFLSILILGIKKIPSSLWIFSMLAILIPASSGTLTSMPRYLLASLGAFIIVGLYLTGKPKLKIIVWTASLFLQIFFAVRFINGYWVA